MTNSYMCHDCGTEHDTVPKALECFQSHQPIEHVAEDAVSLSVPAAKAPELLGRAAALMHERGKTYDTPDGERSMAKTVAAFNAITGRNLTEGEGWLLLQVLKDVRLFARSGYHADSAEDCIAYAALKAEAKGARR